MGGETFDPFTPALDKVVHGLMEEWHVPGMSIAITNHGHISTKGYGVADIETKKPVEPENLFYVASITKHMFSAAFVHFITSEKNKQGPNISLQSPLAEVIREDFVLDTPHTTATTTIEDILSHRSGLPGFDVTYGGPIDTVQKVVRHLRHLTLSESPRTKFQYCNIGYMTASHALEVATGAAFPDYMHKTVFEPLGMKHTFARLVDAQDASHGNHTLVTPYAWENSKLVRRQYLDGDLATGAGSLISSVVDWAKWLNALLYQAGPVSRTVFEEITKPRTIIDDADPEPWDSVPLYCLGLNRYRYRSIEIFAHTGGHCGFTGNMVLIPSLKWAAIMYSNCESTGGFAQIALGYRLVDHLLGVPIPERPDGDRMLRKKQEKYDKFLKEAKPRIYPSIPEPPLPSAQPLHKYAGTYFNPAFRSFTFVARNAIEKDGDESEGAGRGRKTVLFTQPTDRFWPLTITLEHVSGEYWFGRSSPFLRFGFKAEFRLDPQGRVAQLGMALDETDETKLWWFDRTVDNDGKV